MINKYGSWVVGNKIFYVSYDAYRFASETNHQVNFHYHPTVWNNFDRSLLGKNSLPSLYKDRAQQLRDKYDYLILYYSGGADSHNILRTFIDNNIKLDEVCVKWPKPLMDGKFYTPNTTDVSANNYWSEWDYCVKPNLDWLKNNKPEIKITIKDFIGDPDKFDVDGMFEEIDSNSFHAGLLLNSKVSDSERPLIESGKTVANIYGANKPLLRLNGNLIEMFFTDNALLTSVKSRINPYGAENFYWAFDMPLLPFEMAYQTAMHYKLNINDRKFLVLPKKDRKLDTLSVGIQTEAQGIISKGIIYRHTWDNRFQSSKPGSQARLDKFSWFFEQNELSRTKDIFLDNVNQRLALINDRYILTEDYHGTTIKSLVGATSHGYAVTTLGDTLV